MSLRVAYRACNSTFPPAFFPASPPAFPWGTGCYSPPPLAFGRLPRAGAAVSAVRLRPLTQALRANTSSSGFAASAGGCRRPG
jgi:hypothetical protein